MLDGVVPELQEYPFAAVLDRLILQLRIRLVELGGDVLPVIEQPPAPFQDVVAQLLGFDRGKSAVVIARPFGETLGEGIKL